MKSMSKLLTIFASLFAFANIAAASPNFSCTAAITIIDRIGELQAKIDHKLEIGETEGLRQLFTALQTRIRIAKAAGIEIDTHSAKRAVERVETAAQKESQLAEEAREVSAVRDFVEVGREQREKFDRYMPPVYSNGLEFATFQNHELVDGHQALIQKVVNTRTGILFDQQFGNHQWVLSPAGKFAYRRRKNDEGIVVRSTSDPNLQFEITLEDAGLEKHASFIADDEGTVIATDFKGRWFTRRLNPRAEQYSKAIAAMKSEVIMGLDLSPDSRFFLGHISQKHNDGATVWSATTGDRIGALRPYSFEHKYILSADGRTALYVTNKYPIVAILWDVVNVREIGEIQFRGNKSGPLAATPDFETLFVSVDGKVFQLNHGDPDQHLVGSFESINALNFNRTTSTLTVVGEDNVHVQFREKLE
jgi:hypothetical protein